MSSHHQGIIGEVVQETDDAYLLSIWCTKTFPSYPEMWIPKSAFENFKTTHRSTCTHLFEADIAKWVFIAWEREFNKYHRVGEKHKKQVEK